MNCFTASFIVLDVDNIDTDQIIPARFLSGTSRAGMGHGLFADWRYDAGGEPRPDFVINRPEAAAAEALVAGRNFGCGSSREHAAWALADNGFRVVITPQVADIFRTNALKNGILPVVVGADVYRRLVVAGGGRVDIDVGRQTLRLPDGDEVVFELDPFAKHCLMHGVDELGFLLRQEEAIVAYEGKDRRA